MVKRRRLADKADVYEAEEDDSDAEKKAIGRRYDVSLWRAVLLAALRDSFKATGDWSIDGSSTVLSPP